MFINLSTPISTCKKLTDTDKLILSDTISFQETYQRLSQSEKTKDTYKGKNVKSNEFYAWQLGKSRKTISDSIQRLFKLGLIGKLSGVTSTGGYRLIYPMMENIKIYLQTNGVSKPESRKFSLSINNAETNNIPVDFVTSGKVDNTTNTECKNYSTPSVKLAIPECKKYSVNNSIKPQCKNTVTTTSLINNEEHKILHIKKLICEDLGLSINNEIFAIYDISHEWSKTVLNVNIPKKPNTTVIENLLYSNFTKDKEDLFNYLDSRYQQRNIKMRDKQVNLSWLLGLGDNTLNGSTSIEDLIIKENETEPLKYWSSKETAELSNQLFN
ncbi:hypothetical protein ACLKMH_15535 [Psychromonas sp. KJ10-10]|uniref:hypothetical protein n=1 Tax=Psychromonas sp. KJ10-10 TaxID=3391823 RepID=UPI0039B53413